MILKLNLDFDIQVYYLTLPDLARKSLILFLLVALVGCGFVTPPIVSQPGTTTTYATDYERNRQMAAPLATKLGLFD